MVYDRLFKDVDILSKLKGDLHKLVKGYKGYLETHDEKVRLMHEFVSDWDKGKLAKLEAEIKRIAKLIRLEEKITNIGEKIDEEAIKDLERHFGDKSDAVKNSLIRLLQLFEEIKKLIEEQKRFIEKSQGNPWYWLHGRKEMIGLLDRERELLFANNLSGKSKSVRDLFAILIQQIKARIEEGKVIRTIGQYDIENAKLERFVDWLEAEMGGGYLDMLYGTEFWPKFGAALYDIYHKQVLPELEKWGCDPGDYSKVNWDLWYNKKKLLNKIYAGGSLAHDNEFFMRLIGRYVFRTLVREGILSEGNKELFMQAIPNWHREGNVPNNIEIDVVSSVFEREKAALIRLTRHPKIKDINRVMNRIKCSSDYFYLYARKEAVTSEVLRRMVQVPIREGKLDKETIRKIIENCNSYLETSSRYRTEFQYAVSDAIVYSFTRINTIPVMIDLLEAEKTEVMRLIQ